jgi:hypothetical protein
MLTGILRVIQGLAEFEDFIQAARADEQEFVRMVDVLAIAADDIANAAAMLRRSQDEPPILIPDGAPTLLLGNRKTGKSTALLELAVAVARPAGVKRRPSSAADFPPIPYRDSGQHRTIPSRPRPAN